MEHRSQVVFLFLILTQAAHSIEEYITGLYQVFAPARFVSSLISNNIPLGFVMFNVGLVAFGLWCWAVPVRSGWPTAAGFAWFWTILELGNGLGQLRSCPAGRKLFPRPDHGSAAAALRFVAGGSANSSLACAESALQWAREHRIEVDVICAYGGAYLKNILSIPIWSSSDDGR